MLQYRLNVHFDLSNDFLPVSIVVLLYLVVINYILLDVVCHQEGSNDAVLFESFCISGHEILADLKSEGCFYVVLYQVLLPFRDIDEIVSEEEVVPFLNRKRQRDWILLDGLLRWPVGHRDHRLDEFAHVIRSLDNDCFIRTRASKLMVQVIVEVGLQFYCNGWFHCRRSWFSKPKIRKILNLSNHKPDFLLSLHSDEQSER